jgi:hypothetical protein
VNNNADEIAQAERRRIMIEERRMRTYYGHTQHTDEDIYGGRFAKANTTTVVGAGPVSYPQQPAGSPWAKDECPPEPPLGWSVDAQEAVGEKFEVAASTTAEPEVEEPPSPPVHVITSGGDARSRPKFPRRF